jgi:hypothetical protein
MIKPVSSNRISSAKDIDALLSFLGWESASHGSALQIRALHAGAGATAGRDWRSVSVVFHFAYPATRKSANRTNIKITIAAVANTSLSANKRRIGSLPRRSYSARNGISTAVRSTGRARLFDRIHHHVRPADEVLVVGIRRRQVALEHLGGDEALLARPVGG